MAIPSNNITLAALFAAVITVGLALASWQLSQVDKRLTERLTIYNAQQDANRNVLDRLEERVLKLERQQK